MPHWLAPTLIAQASGALLLTLVFYHLYRQSRDRCTLLWSCSFVTYALWIVLERSIHVHLTEGPGAFLVIGSQGAFLVSGFFLLWGTLEFVGKKSSRRWIAAYLVLVVLNVAWIIVAVCIDVAFPVLVRPTCVLLGLIYAYTGIMMLTTATGGDVGKRVAGAAFVLWAIGTFLYPFLQYRLGAEQRADLLAAVFSVVSVTVAIGILVAYFDESRRYRSETEVRFRSLFDKAAIGIVLLDVNGIPLEMNDTFRHMSGYDGDDLATLTLEDMTHPDDMENHESLHGELLAGSRDSYQVKKRFVRKNGRIIWGRLAMSLVRDEAGTPLFFIAMIENLTRRRRAEAARRASEDRFRLLVQKAGSAVVCLSADHQILELSREAERIFGWRRGKMMGKNFFAVVGNSPVGESLAQRMREVLADGEPGDFECVVKHEGSDRTFMWNIAQLKNSRGRHAGTIAIAQDITDRKQAEEALRESEAGYRELVQSANSIIMRRDVYGGITFLNEYAQTFFGYTEQEILGKNVVGTIVPKTDSAGRDLVAMVEDIGRRPDEYATNENENILRNGDRVWVSWTNRAIRDAQGNITGLLCIGNDITLRKRAEMALKESEERYRFLYNTTPVMLFSIDAYGRITRVSDYWLAVMGYERIQVLDHPISEFLTEASAEYAASVVLPEFFRTGVCTDVPLTARKKDGGVIETLLTATADTGVGEGEHSIAVMVDVTERKRAEVALRESEARYRLLFNIGIDAVFVYHLEEDGTAGKFVEVNDVACERLGYTRDDLLGMYIYNITSDASIEALDSLDRELAHRDRMVMEVFQEGADGRKIPVELTVHRFELSGRPSALVVARDMSERRRLEGQLLRAQKMEAIGRLAGGVAHDFNNILTAIMGYSELLLDQIEETSALREHVEEIERAGQRAVVLTRQLLAFSRRQMLMPRVLDLNSIVSGLEPMLRRLIGEDIELILALDASLGRVKADPAQLEQVIMNLIVNSRDAMPSGGTLVISTREADAAEIGDIGNVDKLSGHYVELTVSDTGMGMDAETKEKLFEPFFTTKEQDKGTGLGLSTVYGIVKQSGGYITVESEIDQGTTFRVYLPLSPEALEDEPTETTIGSMETEEGTVLVVEDEHVVRGLVSSILKARGFTVFEAAEGAEALAIAQRLDEPIRLLVSDVVMPGMSGVEVSKALRKLHPETRVLFMSGYTDRTLDAQYGLGEGVGFIQKPFTTAGLFGKVREVLSDKSDADA